ncbi:hypothetical protein H2248_001576 [Termitomyces sp. 'cryptogamus']|nr:hypothetical protein H2248_001576 [Termitomyces sp. 'cryptogamus']
MTPNSMSIGTNTESFPLSDEKGIQTSNSAFDASNLSFRMDKGILAVENFPSPITEHRAQAHVSQPQLLPDMASLQQQRYFSSFSPPFPPTSSSSLSSFGSSCPSLLQTYVPGALSPTSSSDICRDSHMFFTPPSSDQQKAVTLILPSSNPSFHMTEPNALTLPLAHHVSQKTRQKQMQKDARNLPPLSSVQLDGNDMINIVVQLCDDPDSFGNNRRIWCVERESGNVFNTRLWNDGYTYWQEGSSWVFIARHRVIPWETLEPFTVKTGRETQPLRIYRMHFNPAYLRIIGTEVFSNIRAAFHTYRLLVKQGSQSPHESCCSHLDVVATVEGRHLWFLAPILQQLLTHVGPVVVENRETTRRTHN